MPRIDVRLSVETQWRRGPGRGASKRSILRKVSADSLVITNLRRHVPRYTLALRLSVIEYSQSRYVARRYSATTMSPLLRETA